MEELKAKILEYLIATPKILALAIFSFLSGHLWIFVYFTYYKNITGKKGKGKINNKFGKLILGLLWYTLVLIPLYAYEYGQLIRFNYDGILELVISTIVIGLFLQALLLLIIIRIKK